MTARITPNDLRVLAAVIELWREKGYGPSFAEVQQRSGVSASVVPYGLNKLRRFGHIAYTDREARTLRPVTAAVKGWRDGRPVVEGEG